MSIWDKAKNSLLSPLPPPPVTAELYKLQNQMQEYRRQQEAARRMMVHKDFGGTIAKPPEPPKPFTIPPGPDETPEETGARLRHQRFVRLLVTPAPNSMDAGEYREEYQTRAVFPNRRVMEQVEETLHGIHCHACESMSGVMVEASRMFVRIEKDELGAFDRLAHLTCHHCGFEEYYPLEKEIVSSAGLAQTATEVEQRMAAAYQNFPNSMNDQSVLAAAAMARQQAMGIATGIAGAAWGGPLNTGKKP